MVIPDDQRVKTGDLTHFGKRCGIKVLLLISTGDGVLMLEDKMDLVREATLVWAKHDGVGRLVRELFELDTLE